MDIRRQLRPRRTAPIQEQPPQRTKASKKRRRPSPSGEKDDSNSKLDDASDIVPQVFSPAVAADTPPSSPFPQMPPTTSLDNSKDASLEPPTPIRLKRRRKMDGNGRSDMFSNKGSPAARSSVALAKPPVEERRNTPSDDSKDGASEDDGCEKPPEKKRKRNRPPAIQESLLGPYEQYLESSTRREMRAEALALQEENGEELGPLEKMNVWMSRSTLLQRPWPRLQEAEESIRKMRKETLDPVMARRRQEQADEEDRQKEEKRLANKAKYGLGRDGHRKGGGRGGLPG